ncbi:unnamed protein product [Brassica oleracea]
MFLPQSPEFVGERVLTKFWELTPPFRRSDESHFIHVSAEYL